MALCYYSMKNYNAALKHIAEIIERGIREHPGTHTDARTHAHTQVHTRTPLTLTPGSPPPAELSVGMTTEGIEVRSVGNTLILQQTALIEAFNLKAAVQFQLRNCETHTL